MRIFIGTSANGEDAVQEKIIEYSLRKHSSEDIDITWMRNNDSYLGTFEAAKRWATPFSGLRWTVPEACNFEGRALYMDVDMLNLRDISILYNIDLKDMPAAFRTGGRTCVGVFDCKKAQKILAPVSQQKLDPSYHGKAISASRRKAVYFDPKWNCLDGENLKIEDIWHLHFTKMPTQPWKPAWYKGKTAPHRRKDILELWNQYKEEANA